MDWILTGIRMRGGEKHFEFRDGATQKSPVPEKTVFKWIHRTEVGYKILAVEWDGPIPFRTHPTHTV